MASFKGMPINPQKQQELEERLGVLHIRREEVVEKFVRSAGPGGQKVNKTSSAVYLRHLPSGIEIKMQQDRSQAVNRFLAWRLLADKVEARQTGKDPTVQAAERDPETETAAAAKDPGEGEGRWKREEGSKK